MRVFFGSDDLDGLWVWGEPEERLRSHYKDTLAKCRGERRVILVQGSTELPYKLGQDGLDMWKVQKGYSAHVGLIATTKNRALGLVCLKPWSTREDMSELWPGQVHSNRWLEGLESARMIVRRCPQTEVHQVCDVGVGDGLHGLLRAHRDGGPSGTLLVRVTKPGAVRIRFATSKRPVPPSRHLSRLDPIVRGFGFQYGGAGGTKSRYSRATQVTAMAATGHLEPKRGKPTAVTAILVTEDRAPKGLRPFKWLFVANGQELDATGITQLLPSYEQRWTLANYFEVLKSGVKTERRRIRDYYGGIRSRRDYEKCLAQDAETAVTIAELGRVAVDAPDTPAESVKGADMLRVLRA
ncbi:MAG: hypothetical protein OXN89_14900 [Bryobacterales bacterium]|nr:hypothetical protein [Bryobacterales bacterium]